MVILTGGHLQITVTGAVTGSISESDLAVGRMYSMRPPRWLKFDMCAGAHSLKKCFMA